MWKSGNLEISKTLIVHVRHLRFPNFHISKSELPERWINSSGVGESPFP
jgi:hypothetical protein